MYRHTAYVICLGPQLGLGVAMESPRDPTLSPPPHQQLPYFICLLFVDARVVLMGRRDVFWALWGMARVGARRILFTAASFAQVLDLGSGLDSSRMWSSQRCQIVITVRYNFLPLPLPLHQAHGVHLFMETVRSWLGIFRQSLCWAGVTSRQSPTCQHHPASLLHLFVVKF